MQQNYLHFPLERVKFIAVQQKPFFNSQGAYYELRKYGIKT